MPSLEQEQIIIIGSSNQFASRIECVTSLFQWRTYFHGLENSQEEWRAFESTEAAETTKTTKTAETT